MTEYDTLLNGLKESLTRFRVTVGGFTLSDLIVKNMLNELNER